MLPKIFFKAIPFIAHQTLAIKTYDEKTKTQHFRFSAITFFKFLEHFEKSKIIIAFLYPPSNSKPE